MTQFGRAQALPPFFMPLPHGRTSVCGLFLFLINMPTVNGCWNCEHGGLLKLLRNLVRSMEFEHGIELTPACKTELTVKVLPEKNRCSLDSGLHIEPGFICGNWKYDGLGFHTPSIGPSPNDKKLDSRKS